jgi:hypothetical protein
MFGFAILSMKKPPFCPYKEIMLQQIEKNARGKNASSKFDPKI